MSRGGGATPKSSTSTLQQWFRRGALASLAVVIACYGSVLYDVADVVGDATLLIALAGGSLLLATLMARLLRPRTAVVLTGGLLLAGLAAYLNAVPESQLALVTPEKLLHDAVTMLTGLSVLRLLAAGTWALTVAPGPTFLAWYLGIRRRYAAAVAVAGGTLGLFVLTGDAGELVTLLGVVAGAVTIGLGNLERVTATRSSERSSVSSVDSSPAASLLTPGVRAQLETLTAVLAAMILLSSTIGLAAGGGVTLAASGGNSGATEASLVSSSDRLRVAGSISLSPKVRMVVQSTEQSYWRTAVYDRYTGGGWVRTQKLSPYQGPLPSPPGESERIRQTVIPRTELDVMPASNAPVRVDNAIANRTLVTPQGGLRPADTLGVNESYTVTSQRPVASPEQLRAAGTAYPASVSSYRQLPSSTPDRVTRRTSEIVGDESTAYDSAVAIKQYLERNKEYSLTVNRPTGDIADSFLFEMDAGYCTYFATTMVVMLRTQNIPARLAVGYTPGQTVDQQGGSDAGEEMESYVVRGMNAHVWVEVYFPDIGWVRFDPTPAAPREAAEQEQLRTARANDVPNIDTYGSQDEGPTPTPTPAPSPNGSTPITVTTASPSSSNATVAEPQSGTGGGFVPSLPSGRTLGLWAIAIVGAAAASRRTGLSRQLQRTVGVYYQRRRDPETDVQRAWRRIEDQLGRQYRDRRPGETPRAYLDTLAAEHDLDPWVYDVVTFYERARYGDGITETQATGAVQRADSLTRRSIPLLGRWVRRRSP